MYHTTEILEALARARPELLARTTVCSIDEPGPDTSSAIAAWLQRYPPVQVAARTDTHELPATAAQRVVAIDAAQLTDLTSFAKLIASLLLPGGVLVQDIHLSTLQFIPRDRWWESIYVAVTVRGMFARRQPAVRFVSNKRGYAATFGRDLMDAGFDPREVMDKTELDQVIVPSIARDVEARFPLDLTTTDRRGSTPLASDEESRREIEDRLDLVEWDVSGRIELSGRLLPSPVVFRPASQEALTWQRLIADRISAGPGVPVAEVGRRLAEPGAERAEMSNLAARHIHALRARLSSSAAIVTVNHAYRLDPAVSAGRVRRHLRPPSLSRPSNTDGRE